MEKNCRAFTTGYKADAPVWFKICCHLEFDCISQIQSVSHRKSNKTFEPKTKYWIRGNAAFVLYSLDSWYKFYLEIIHWQVLVSFILQCAISEATRLQTLALLKTLCLVSFGYFGVSASHSSAKSSYLRGHIETWLLLVNATCIQKQVAPMSCHKIKHELDTEESFKMTLK